MDPKHKEMIENMFSTLSFNLTEVGKIDPLFLMVLPDNSIRLVMVAEKGQLETREYASLSIAAASDMDAKALILICEQYMVKRKKDDPELQSFLTGQLRPSEAPDHQEYLTIVYTEKDGTTESLISQIHSDLVGRRYTIDFKWLKYSTTNLITPWN